MTSLPNICSYNCSGETTVTATADVTATAEITSTADVTATVNTINFKDIDAVSVSAENVSCDHLTIAGEDWNAPPSSVEIQELQNKTFALQYNGQTTFIQSQLDVDGILHIEQDGSYLNDNLTLNNYNLILVDTGRIQLGPSSNYGWIMRGQGSPEGVQTGYGGSIYLRSDGGPGTYLYVKESSSWGNTGWVAK